MDFNQTLRSVIHTIEPKTFASSEIGVNRPSATQGCLHVEQASSRGYVATAQNLPVWTVMNSIDSKGHNLQMYTY